MSNQKITKLSMDFTPEDMKVLNALRREMAIEQGRVTIVSVIRAAIRTAAKDKLAA